MSVFFNQGKLSFGINGMNLGTAFEDPYLKENFLLVCLEIDEVGDCVQIL